MLEPTLLLIDTGVDQIYSKCVLVMAVAFLLVPDAGGDFIMTQNGPQGIKLSNSSTARIGEEAQKENQKKNFRIATYSVPQTEKLIRSPSP